MKNLSIEEKIIVEELEREYEYEQYRKNTGHITNFSKKDLKIYVDALIQYNFIQHHNLRIGVASNKVCDYGLYKKNNKKLKSDLTPFWNIFRDIQESTLKENKK